MNEHEQSSEETIWSPATAASGLLTGMYVIVARTNLTVPAVETVMTREVYAVADDTSLDTAARLMAARHISGMPVLRGRTPIGVVSLSDLVDPDRERGREIGYPLYYRLAASGERVELGDDVQVGHGRVADVMSPFVLSIEASASLLQAALLMLSEGVHRLLVRAGTELVGIVTSMDLLRGFVGILTSREGMGVAGAG